jgi:hypothetical protein
MFKNRGGLLILLIIIALAVIAFLLIRRGGSFPRLLGPREATPTVPLDLQQFIPAGWTVQAEPRLECNFDDDPDLEQLLIYRYNPTTLQNPLEKAGTTVTYSPFGGVIFDTQTSSLQPQPNPPGAYRPSNIVPYLLLPDFYPGKGEGYLGETSVQIRYAPTPQEGATCATSEINIFGFTNGPLPTRLSVLAWAGRDSGYQGSHFVGNARVESDILPQGGNKITRVTTYNRLLNHRSILCDVNGYVRPSLSQLAFISDASLRTIDFCFGTPSEPVYPEGIVVALLRGQNSGSGTPSNYLLNDATYPAELDLKNPARKPNNIVSVGNPSWVTPIAIQGDWCTAAQVGTPLAAAAPSSSSPITATSTSVPSPSGGLWCGRERVRIETRIILNGQPRDLGWVLISVRPDVPGGGIYWRVQEVEML